MKKPKLILLYLLLFINFSSFSQKKKKQEHHPLDEISINALKWRSVGPALTSGRISDIAVNTQNPFEYYVAVASEFQAMAHLPNVNNAKIYEPEPGVFYTWEK